MEQDEWRWRKDRRRDRSMELARKYGESFMALSARLLNNPA